jgi:hypothetical protein
VSVLFGRDLVVRVQVAAPEPGEDVAPAIEITGLDVDFQIRKSLRPEPNSCELTIYNLTREQARAIEALNTYDPKRTKGQKRPKKNLPKGPRAPKSGKIRVEIEAGYDEVRSLIFRGDLRRAITTEDGETRTTKIEGEDGGKSILGSRITEAFPAGTSMATVARACIAAMGLGQGNFLEVEDVLSAQKVSGGLVLNGIASEELSAIMRRLGVRWSVQNGVLRFQQRDVDVARGYLLNSETGMVSTPARESTGMVKVTALLNPALQIGGFVTVESELQEFTGSYQIAELTYVGQKSGTQWFAELSLKAV